MELDERMMMLIAVGASIAANCQPCLQFNITKARECGAAEQEIATAIDVGKRVRKGAASAMDDFTLSLNQTASLYTHPSDEECVCSA